MMTQSVMTQAASLLGSTTGSATSKGKQVGNGFDLVIERSLKSDQKLTDKTDAYTAKTSVKNADATDSTKSDKADTKVDKTDTAQTKETAATDNTKTVNKTEAKTTDKVDNNTVKESNETSITEEVPIDNSVLAQITAMLQAVRAQVMETLNLTSEQLDQLMMEQGMSASDLLGQENLQQLVLANSGETNILATLTDENLADTMKQLLQGVEDIKNEAGLNLTKEQIESILTQVEAANQTEETPVTMVEESSTKVDLGQGKEAANVIKKEDVQTNSETSNKKDTSAQISTLSETKESNTDAQSEAGTNTNKELRAEDQYQVFVDNLVKSTGETKVDFAGNLVQVTELRDIANQIIDRIKVSIQPNQTSMELQLNPENLGKVNLTVQSKNGVLTAQFVVQNEISKEAIESQMQSLKDTLNQQGLKVDT
ncbi:MAG: flagellar hook-length control protein FliK, partial [Mobilitalea sp.]